MSPWVLDKFSDSLSFCREGKSKTVCTQKMCRQQWHWSLNLPTPLHLLPPSSYRLIFQLQNILLDFIYSQYLATRQWHFSLIHPIVVSKYINNCYISFLDPVFPLYAPTDRCDQWDSHIRITWYFKQYVGNLHRI